MGLARWRQVERRIVDSGAELVLCGHDHQEGAEVVAGKVVVSTTGTLCTRSRGGRPSCFNFVTIEPTAGQVAFLPRGAEGGGVQGLDTHAFPRPRAGRPAPPPSSSHARPKPQ